MPARRSGRRAIAALRIAEARPQPCDSATIGAAAVPVNAQSSPTRARQAGLCRFAAPGIKASVRRLTSLAGDRTKRCRSPPRGRSPARNTRPAHSPVRRAATAPGSVVSASAETSSGNRGSRRAPGGTWRDAVVRCLDVPPGLRRSGAAAPPDLARPGSFRSRCHRQ